MVFLYLLIASAALGRKIQKRPLRYLATAAGMIFSAVLAAYLAGGLGILFGDGITNYPAVTGSYAFEVVAAYCVIKGLLFLKKKANHPD